MSTLSPVELKEIKRQKIASMSKEEQRDMLNQVCERAEKRFNDEFIRQQGELHKQEHVQKGRRN